MTNNRFHLHLRVDDRQGSLAPQFLADFISQAQQHYDLQLLSPLPAPAATDTPACAEAFISVPFADRERIRIDFNLFASQADTTVGTPYRLHFHMESVPPQDLTTAQPHNRITAQPHNRTTA